MNRYHIGYLTECCGGKEYTSTVLLQYDPSEVTLGGACVAAVRDVRGSNWDDWDKLAMCFWSDITQIKPFMSDRQITEEEFDDAKKFLEVITPDLSQDDNGMTYWDCFDKDGLEV